MHRLAPSSTGWVEHLFFGVVFLAKTKVLHGKGGKGWEGISNGRLPFDIPYSERKDSIASSVLDAIASCLSSVGPRLLTDPI